MDTSDIIISDIKMQKRFKNQRSSTLSGNQSHNNAESSPSVSFNVSELDSSKKSLNRSVNTLNASRDQMRKKKQ